MTYTLQSLPDWVISVTIASGESNMDKWLQALQTLLSLPAADAQFTTAV